MCSCVLHIGVALLSTTLILYNESGIHFHVYLPENWIDLDETWQSKGCHALSLSPILLHLFLFPSSSRRVPSNPWIWGDASLQLGDFGERCKLLQRGPGQQRLAANAFSDIVSSEKLRKHILWQQFWVTLFWRSKNFKCRGYWQTNGTNAWDFKPPAWQREMDLECLSVRKIGLLYWVDQNKIAYTMKFVRRYISKTLAKKPSNLALC